MIIKSSTFLYLFDFDGTLVGNNQWKNYLYNTIDCFRFLRYNPSLLDIRWCILSSRPKIDRFIIWLICKYHKLKTNQILTSNTLFYNFKTDEDSFRSKEIIIKQILDQEIKINNFVKPIEKIVFIDNDFSCIKYLNGKKEHYKYIAISVSDFLLKDFIFLLTE